jgi:hypothetical protein
MIHPAHAASPLVACQPETTGGAPVCVVNMASYVKNPATGAAFCTIPATGPIPLCEQNLQAAVKDAQLFFATTKAGVLINATKTYVINIPAGTYDLTAQTATLPNANGVIDVSGIAPAGTGCLSYTGPITGDIALSGSGCLVITGAGSASTKLITADYLAAVFGRQVSHIMLNGMTLTQPNVGVTQGSFVSSNTTVTVTLPTGSTLTYPELILDMSPGFPTPATLYNRAVTFPPGGPVPYMRAYANGPVPSPIMSPSSASTELNMQRPWSDVFFQNSLAAKVAPRQVNPAEQPNRWAVPLGWVTGAANIPPYYADTTGQTPALVCLKLDSLQALYFTDLANGGSDIVLNDITLVNAARSSFRGIRGSLDGRIHGVQIFNSSIARGPAINGQVPCLSSAGGGFQIGSLVDLPIYGTVIYNLQAEATGDDTVAIFNDIGGASIDGQAYPQSYILASKIGDSFVRNINLYNDQAVTSLPISPVYVDAATQDYIRQNGHCDPFLSLPYYPQMTGCPMAYTHN